MERGPVTLIRPGHADRVGGFYSVRPEHGVRVEGLIFAPGCSCVGRGEVGGIRAAGGVKARGEELEDRTQGRKTGGDDARRDFDNTPDARFGEGPYLIYKFSRGDFLVKCTIVRLTGHIGFIELEEGRETVDTGEDDAGYDDHSQRRQKKNFPRPQKNPQAS